MAPGRLSPTRRTGSPWAGRVGLAGRVLFVLAMLALLVHAAMSLPYFTQVLSRLSDGGALAAVGILAYLGAHMLRALRLAIIAGGHEISLRRLTSVHFATAGVSLLLPFKLGEVYRIFELSQVAGGLRRAVQTVWMERAFDVAALVVMMLVVAVAPMGAAAVFAPLSAAAALFIVLTVITFVVLPGNLRTLSLFVIRRYRSERAVTALRALDGALRFVESGRQLLRNKQGVVGAVSAFIWALEVASFGLVVAAIGPAAEPLLESFLAYVSTASFGAAQWYPVYGTGAESLLAFPVKVFVYGVLTRLPLFICALVLGVMYAPARLRGGLSLGSASSLNNGNAQ
ncbi:lysylphosphatidylglycerol synthase domain-containing protein [Paracidovorax citrulli]